MNASGNDNGLGSGWRIRRFGISDLDQPIRVRRCADLKSGHIDALSLGHRPMGFYSPLCLYKGRIKWPCGLFFRKGQVALGP
jgi:hypothetical protein